MRIKIYLSLALVLFSINLLGGEKLKKEVKIIHENRVEETIVYDSRTNKPIKKSICVYLFNNQMIEKVVYLKNRYGFWIPSYKYEISYRESHSTTPYMVKYTRWNPVTELWERNSKTMKCIE